MFNVYLPKLLEARSNSGDNGAPKSLNDSLWDVVIYSVGGCPGAIVSLIPFPPKHFVGSDFNFFCFNFLAARGLHG